MQSLRMLKIMTVVMGVLIVLGVAVVGVTIARRMGGISGQSPRDVQLAEPAGTRIAAIAGVQERLAVLLQGGGPDRVVLVDPRTGLRTGTLSLGPRPPGGD